MSTATPEGQGRVMVVDDDVVNLILAREVLQLFGVDPVTWSDGHSALQDFESRPFGLVFMDIHMPGLSGFEVTDRIRAFERQTGRKRTPIVALTASAMPHELSACTQRDMDAVLSKPFAFDAMRAMLGRWLVLSSGE
jgi:two-component system, sensor histidine kinase